MITSFFLNINRQPSLMNLNISSQPAFSSLNDSSGEWSGLPVILEHLDFAVVVSDAFRKTIFVNHHAFELFEFSENNLPDTDAVVLLNQIADTFRNKDLFLGQWREAPAHTTMVHHFLMESRNSEFLECKQIPLFREGCFYGYMWQFINVTGQKKYENEIREAQVRAENSAKSREVFLANMSHEIRTPMNAILGMAGLLEKTRLSGKQKSYLEAIRVSSEHLLAIINDILDMSKIEAGKLVFENIGFDFQKVVSDAIQSLSYLAASKSVSLGYSIDAGIEKILIGDPVRLEQIFLNLISNAIKFTNQGSVEVNCVLKENTDTTNCIECKISDTGIGIDKDKLSVIFDSFIQEDTSTTRNFGGTGLGLSITKQLVERMNGTIEVESEKGKGTIFTFCICYPKGTPQDLPVKNNQKPEYMSLRGTRILMVEDNKWNQILATAILESWQMEVHIAQNGLDAVKMLKKEVYDIVIMDIQMPKMGGVEAARIIRDELKSDIPIVALTANAIIGDKEKFLNAGMDAYLTKPFEEVALFETLSKLLGNPEDRAKYQEERLLLEKNLPVSPELTVSMLASPLYNLTKLKEYSHGNEQFVRKMLRLFLEQTPDAVNEIAENFRNGNLQRVRSIAHQIKPSIDLLCLEQIQNEIRLVERYADKDINLDELPAYIEKIKQVIQVVGAELEAELQKEVLL